MEFLLKTERLMIQPYSNSYLEQYFKEFTDEIVKYQYPDSFCDMNKADEVMSKFVTDMEQGKMLELVILCLLYTSPAFLKSLRVCWLRMESLSCIPMR